MKLQYYQVFNKNVKCNYYFMPVGVSTRNVHVRKFQYNPLCNKDLDHKSL